MSQTPNMTEAGTDRPEVLLVAADPAQVLPALEAHFTVHRLDNAPDRSAFVASIADRVRAMVTGTLVGADGALIAALPRLEIVAVSGGHVDRIDMAAARARGIRVTNAPGISAPDVADLAMALIIALMRRLVEGVRVVRAGRRPGGAMSFGRRVTGKRLGIVGLGAIGRILARRAAGFDIKVGYHGPRRKDDVAYAYYDDLIAMVRAVDILVVCCRSGPATRHLVNAAVLEALGPNGILVNVARGSVVDETALIRALARGDIAGAALDVFENEPHVPRELLAMSNVIVQAHVGAFTHEAKQTMADLAVANLRAHFAGRPLLTPVA